jgi:hypothetical protein
VRKRVDVAEVAIKLSWGRWPPFAPQNPAVSFRRLVANVIKPLTVPHHFNWRPRTTSGINIDQGACPVSYGSRRRPV